MMPFIIAGSKEKPGEREREKKDLEGPPPDPSGLYRVAMAVAKEEEEEGGEEKRGIHHRLRCGVPVPERQEKREEGKEKRVPSFTISHSSSRAFSRSGVARSKKKQKGGGGRGEKKGIGWF